MRGSGKLPEDPDLVQIATLQQTGVPLAADYAAMQNVPARLFDFAMIWTLARSEAMEWQQMEAEAKRGV